MRIASSLSVSLCCLGFAVAAGCGDTGGSSESSRGAASTTDSASGAGGAGSTATASGAGGKESGSSSAGGGTGSGMGGFGGAGGKESGTGGMASGGGGMASGAGGMASGTGGMGTGAGGMAGMASSTSGMASGAGGMASGAGGMGAGGMASGAGGMAAGAGGMLSGTGGMASSTSGMASSTGGMASGTGGMGAGGMGAGGMGAGGMTSGGGGMGGSLFCTPQSIMPCYTGPLGTLGVGACTLGMTTCNADGSGYGPCVGEVVPSPETCATAVDDDCDGMVNEEGADCVCAPGSSAPCYTGAMGTQNVGPCKAGVAQCNALGTAYGACIGEVVPSQEACATPEDDDCDGMVNEEGADCVCVPNSTATCYSGPPNTENVGPCKAGTKTCNALGTAYGACVGEVTPGVETCLTPIDDDCDGQVNENGNGCVCAPFSTQSCYSGAAGTLNVGICKAGTRTCNAQGTGYGACVGEVVPATETCATPTDEDCDGQANEGCAALTCSLYQENFDDGSADPVTVGVYKLDWCDTYIPNNANTPLCMSGRTLRTNDSTIDPTIWIYKGAASCTQVKVTYDFYQFALAGVSLEYQQSDDVIQSCEKSGVFTSVASHTPLQACTQKSVTIPFGTKKGVYIRFEHGSGMNAIWLDNLTIELQGCDC